MHLIPVRVSQLSEETPTVRVLELQPEGGHVLPPCEAGAHIDLHLPNGMSRSYSLIGPPGEASVYRIAVARDAVTRGGSAYVHDHMPVGTPLQVSAPRNHFALDESAPLSVLIAGGIGITPLWCMAQRLNQIGRRWRLHYACRTRELAAFQAPLAAAAAAGDGEVAFWWDDENGGRHLDVRALVAAAPAQAHLYCCGPAPMIAAFRAAAETRPPETVHFESFKATPVAKDRPLGGFVVELARTGTQVAVPAGSTILDALMMQGIDAPYSCYEGLCGTCETRVLEGIPDHRDEILTAKAKASNETIIICCSGSKSPRLVLDL
jgi:tetrachlorobenzoquinone reductase